MVDSLEAYLPRKDKIKSVDLKSSQPLRDIFLDYIFIFYSKDRGKLDDLNKLLEDQDEYYEKRKKNYTQEHINTLYDKSLATLDDIKDDSLSELLTETYKKYRIKVSKDIINWAKTFDAEVEDIKQLKVSDVFVEEKMTPLTGRKDVKVRQLMQRIADGEGLSDANILQRIKEKGKLIEIGEKQKGRVGYEIRVPVISAENPLSNHKQIKAAGIKFASRGIDNPKLIKGKEFAYNWPIPAGDFKKLLDSEDLEDFFHRLAKTLYGNFPVDLIPEDYKEIRNINDLTIYFTFFKGKLFENLGTSFEELDKLEIKDSLKIPLKITIDYSTHATLEFELGGKELRGKVGSPSQVKRKIQKLKEELNREGLSSEEKKNIKEKIEELKKELEEVTDKESDIKETEEARRGDISTEEGERIEGEEELEQYDKPESKKIQVGPRVIPELEKYFRTIRARIEELEYAINEIKNQETNEV
tara:strand:- start:693 stop:2105 length:1413 start_codon:yes stop_codon:yes gene_type:complete